VIATEVESEYLETEDNFYVIQFGIGYNASALTRFTEWWTYEKSPFSPTEPNSIITTVFYYSDNSHPNFWSGHYIRTWPNSSKFRETISGTVCRTETCTCICGAFCPEDQLESDDACRPYGPCGQHPTGTAQVSFDRPDAAPDYHPHPVPLLSIQRLGDLPRNIKDGFCRQYPDQCHDSRRLFIIEGTDNNLKDFAIGWILDPTVLTQARIAELWPRVKACARSESCLWNIYWDELTDEERAALVWLGTLPDSTSWKGFFGWVDEPPLAPDEPKIRHHYDYAVCDGEWKKDGSPIGEHGYFGVPASQCMDGTTGFGAVFDVNGNWKRGEAPLSIPPVTATTSVVRGDQVPEACPINPGYRTACYYYLKVTASDPDGIGRIMDYSALSGNVPITDREVCKMFDNIPPLSRLPPKDLQSGIEGGQVVACDAAGDWATPRDFYLRLPRLRCGLDPPEEITVAYGIGGRSGNGLYTSVVIPKDDITSPPVIGPAKRAPKEELPVVACQLGFTEDQCIFPTQAGDYIAVPVTDPEQGLDGGWQYKWYHDNENPDSEQACREVGTPGAGWQSPAGFCAKPPLPDTTEAILFIPLPPPDPTDHLWVYARNQCGEPTAQEVAIPTTPWTPPPTAQISASFLYPHSDPEKHGMKQYVNLTDMERVDDIADCTPPKRYGGTGYSASEGVPAVGARGNRTCVVLEIHNDPDARVQQVTFTLEDPPYVPPWGAGDPNDSLPNNPGVYNDFGCMKSDGNDNRRADGSQNPQCNGDIVPAEHAGFFTNGHVTASVTVPVVEEACMAGEGCATRRVAKALLQTSTFGGNNYRIRARFTPAPKACVDPELEEQEYALPPDDPPPPALPAPRLTVWRKLWVSRSRMGAGKRIPRSLFSLLVRGMAVGSRIGSWGL